MDGGATHFAWPVGRLSDAVEALSRLSGMRAKPAFPSSRRRGRAALGAEAIQGELDSISRTLDFEVNSADVAHGQIEGTLATAGPALLKLTHQQGDRLIVLVGSAGKQVKLLACDGRTHRVAAATVAGWIKQHLEEPAAMDVDALLADTGVPTRRWGAARRALLAARLGSVTATRCWMLRPSPAACLWQHMRHAGLPRRMVVFILAYAAAAVASLGAWALIGAAALEGRFDGGTLLAWSFLLLSLVPLGLFAMWSQGVFMLGLSGIFKMQLIAGALKLDPDEMRRQGPGQQFARVLDCSSFEGLALAGGFYALTAFFDLALAITILIATSAGRQLAVLLLFVAAVAGIAVVYFRARERWTSTRQLLTHALVERMVGHRTRLVQAWHSEDHGNEDEALSRYVDVSKHMDRAAMALSIVPRAWLLVGLAVIAPQFATGDATPAMLAVGLGTTLLASGALGKLAASLTTLVDAAVSWKQMVPLLQALRTPEAVGHVGLAGESVLRMRESRGGPLVAAHDLAFRFHGRAGPILSDCGFRIAAGDRIHLTGPSGGGKSTLVSLLAGLRVPDSGVLLLQGLDRATLGSDAWRRRIVVAPQFQENHLFSETLAFNLLMGRRWPPTADDLRWAEVVCRRLELGALIDRMPAGLFQPVGETGWQLSHGERSRVFMARALLGGADLVILDESFAELDPESLQRCLPEAARLSKAILVIAHA